MNSTVRRIVLAASVALAALTVPRCVAGRDANAVFDGDLATQDALAQTTVRAVLEADGPLFYHTGSERFDGQSAVAIYQMALLGLGQIVIAHPEKLDGVRAHRGAPGAGAASRAPRNG